MLNRAMIIGNLGRDPEIRTTQSGNKVCNLNVATTERWKSKDGQQQERTEWLNVVIWNKHLVDVAERYLRKGSKVYLEGQIQTRKWKDQQGNDRYTTEIVLNPFKSELVMLSDKQEPKRGGTVVDHRGPVDMDTEIPFAPLRELP